jgi:hypothetical protein
MMSNSVNRRDALKLGVAFVGGMIFSSVQAVRAEMQKIILGPGESVTVEAEALSSPSSSPLPSPEPSAEPSPSLSPSPSPSPASTPGATRMLMGDQPEGITVPTGETWRIHGLVTTPKNVVVHGTLQGRAGDTLRFRDVNEAAFVGGGMEPAASDVGLWLRPGGALDFQGTPKSGWHRARTGLLAGQRGIILDADPVGWNVGDEIVIAPTLPPTDRNYLQVENRTIAGISGRNVLLDSGLTCAHPAVEVKPGKVMTAEVANLTRDCLIEGTPNGRTHFHAMPSSPQTIKYTLFRHMGPQKLGPSGKPEGVFGRYPMHFHMVEDATRGSLIEGCVIRDSGHHGFVSHSSHGMTFRDCIGFDCQQAPFWWDVDDSLGDEAPHTVTLDTDWDHCLAIRTGKRTGRDGGFVLNAGGSSSTGPGTNTMRNCVNVADYLRADAISSSDHAGVFWNNGIWIFDDNVTHNGDGYGFGLWYNAGTDIAHRAVVYHHKQVMLMGAYNNAYSWIDCIFARNEGLIVISAFGHEGMPLRFTRCYFDERGAFFVDGNSKGVSGPLVVEDSVLKGYGDAALFVPDTGKSPLVAFNNCQFSGNEMHLSDGCGVDTRVHVNDATRNLVARRKDSTIGTFYAPWNAKVSGTRTP